MNSTQRNRIYTYFVGLVGLSILTSCGRHAEAAGSVEGSDPADVAFLIGGRVASRK
jgi:hypothetical protein